MLTRLAAVGSAINFNSANILKVLSVVTQQRNMHHCSLIPFSHNLQKPLVINKEDEEKGIPIYFSKAQLESNTKWRAARQQAEAGNLKEFIKAYNDWKNYNKERPVFYWDYSQHDLLDYAKTPEIQNYLIEDGAQPKPPIYFEIVESPELKPK